MALDRYINISIHLFEHDDELEFMQSILNQLEYLIDNYDVAGIRITADSTYNDYLNDAERKRISKLEEGSG
jgi:hypothetical protein